MTKILFIGSSPNFTGGYGVIADNMGKELIDMGYDVNWIGIEYGQGNPIEYYKGGKIYAGGDYMKWSVAIREIMPDIIFHIRDNWVFTPFYNGQPYTFKELWKAGIKQVNMTPVDSYVYPREFFDSIDKEAHLTLIPSRWGKEVVMKNGVNKVDYLYHGVDRTIFKYKETNKSEGKKFIFVGTNFDNRKNIPFILKAFKEYKNRTDDKEAKLYLHTNLLGAFELPWFIQFLGLKLGEDVLVKEYQGTGVEGGISSWKLADWYNWADCYITGTTAEGFNIPLLEAMSVGLSAVVTDFPVHREIFSRFGGVYFAKSYEEFPTNVQMRWIPDLDDFVEGMIKCEGKKKRADELFSEFSWRYVTERFIKILEEWNLI